MRQGKFTSLTKNKITNSLRNLGINHSHKILCAVSGGGDSMAMLFLLQNFFRGEIGVCHFDHSTRNGESHSDAEFVKNYCALNSLPFFLEVLPPDCERNGQSFEDFARQKRYSFFDKICKEENYDFIATAHNKNDNAETQIFNFFRGGGIKAMAGIPQMRGVIIRPVLAFTSDELRQILQDNNIAHVEDETNKECIYTRNKIRHILLPWVEQNINQNVLDTLENTATIAKETYDYVFSTAQKNYNKVIVSSDNTQQILRKEARGIEPVIMKEILKLLGINLQAHPLEARRLILMEQLIRSDNPNWIFEWEERLKLKAKGEIVEILIC